MPVKKISILGSTGSIGRQALEVISQTGCAEVVALTARSNINLLKRQIAEFNPQLAVLEDDYTAWDLNARLRKEGLKTDVYHGMDGLIAAATLDESDIVLNALVGTIGIKPTLMAIQSKKNIALANKESLVSAGHIIIPEILKAGVSLYPVDSEHSAILQCLQDNNATNIDNVKKIYLTASGGPFRNVRRISELENITPEQALKHPNWSMGKKVTIDSATLMNKGLEVIEAKWLFDIPVSKIEVIIHPQSIVHSMVEFIDGIVMAQLGPPDMRLPIQYALNYPKRIANNFSRLNFFDNINLTFEKPQFDLFRCPVLALDAINAGGAMPAVMNAANEVAVNKFLNGQIKFLNISDIIDKTMSAYNSNNDGSTLEGILEADLWAREYAGLTSGGIIR